MSQIEDLWEEFTADKDLLYRNNMTLKSAFISGVVGGVKAAVTANTRSLRELRESGELTEEQCNLAAQHVGQLVALCQDAVSSLVEIMNQVLAERMEKTGKLVDGEEPLQ